MPGLGAWPSLLGREQAHHLISCRGQRDLGKQLPWGSLVSLILAQWFSERFLAHVCVQEVGGLILPPPGLLLFRRCRPGRVSLALCMGGGDFLRCPLPCFLTPIYLAGAMFWSFLAQVQGARDTLPDYR